MNIGERVYSEEFGYGVFVAEDSEESIVSFDLDDLITRAVKPDSIEIVDAKHELRMLSAKRSGRGLASWDRGQSFNTRLNRIMVRFYGKKWKERVRLSDIM
tara:strand:+ start:507 stop:809 length:303 start_codon:yes stop_codon:yes gene_type:complete